MPFVTRIVPTIDLENQRAVIDPPPGLIDTAEAEVVRGESDGVESGAEDETGAGDDGDEGDA